MIAVNTWCKFSNSLFSTCWGSQMYHWNVEHQNLLFILFAEWGFQCCCCPFDLVWVEWLTSFYSCYKCTGIFMFNQSFTFFFLEWYSKYQTITVHKHYFLGPCRKDDFFSKQVCTEFGCPGLQLLNKHSAVDLGRQNKY